MKLQYYLNENKNITLYHGSDYKTQKIDSSLMMQTLNNSLEGVGIYFGDLEMAEHYGNKIISINIDSKKIIPSHGTVGKYLPHKNVLNLIKDLYKISPEDIFYLISDYIEITDSTDIDDSVIVEFIKKLEKEEIRNFQITMAQSIGVEVFVDGWNKHLPNIIGTFEKKSQIYCIINTSIKVTKVT